MQQTLDQEFNEVAREASEAFPQMERFVVVNPAAEKWIYVPPQVAAELTNDATAIKNAFKKIADDMRTIGAEGITVEQDYFAGTPVKLTALLDIDRIRGPFSDRLTKEMRMYFTLNHEIGHQILRNGLYRTAPAHIAESAADAFATLQHIKRFGKDTDIAGFLCASRTEFIVYAKSASHYSMKAIQRAFEVADEKDLSRMSLRQTAELAAQIADENHYDETKLNKIQEAFAPVGEIQKSYYTRGHFTGDPDQYYMDLCLKTFSIMEKNQNDPDIFATGKYYLSGPHRKAFMTAAADMLGYWKDALAFVNTHQSQTSLKMPKMAAPF